MTDYISLLPFIAAVFVTALSGAKYSPGSWYEELNKPSWQPPNWVFPIAWTILFIMIAISGWLIWREVGAITLPLVVYGIQLVLNYMWSWLFFGKKRMDLALFEVGLLWLSIVAMIVLFYPISETAALLLLPYLAWVSFAAFLNFTMLRLNPEEGRNA